MKTKKSNVVKLKRQLQKKADKKFAGLTEKEQLELLRKKFGHLRKQKIDVSST